MYKEGFQTRPSPEDISKFISEEIRNTLIPNITAEIQSTQTAFDRYNSSNTNVQPLLDQRNHVGSSLRDKQHRLNELNQLDETYTKTYLDFKENPVKGGIFYKFGLRTTQDWTIAFFYLSFIVFSVVILLYTFVTSVQKIYAVAFVFTCLCIFGLLTTTWITYYG